MREQDVLVDVSGVAGLQGALHIAATVYLPDAIDGSTVVFVAFPGGGYGRKYYDIDKVPGYSQAEFHTSRGAIFVACDHLGTGESARVDFFEATFERLAAANHTASTVILDRLCTGSLIEAIAPVEVEKVVGIGQSMGACVLTVQQGTFKTFDGVALLGWSGIHTNFPAPGGGRITWALPSRSATLRDAYAMLHGMELPTLEQYRYAFHWPGDEPALVEPDMAQYPPGRNVVRGDDRTPWGSSRSPAITLFTMTEGVVAVEAAAIDVPVLSACGERDLVPDPWAEPTAYRHSNDVSLFVVPRMAHMHNFASTRELLWTRLERFAESVTSR
jgi:alpha-beta hydrolase superfamily lysophospholipase